MKAKWLSKNVILVLPPEAVIIYDSSGGPRSVVLQEYFSFISIYEFQIKYSFISTSMISTITSSVTYAITLRNATIHERSMSDSCWRHAQRSSASTLYEIPHTHQKYILPVEACNPMVFQCAIIL